MEPLSDAKKVNHEGSQDKPLKGGLMKTDSVALSAKNNIEDRESYSAQHHPSNSTSASDGNSGPGVNLKSSAVRKTPPWVPQAFLTGIVIFPVSIIVFLKSRIENLIHAL